MLAPQLINCQWFAAVTGSVIRVSPARGLEGPTVSSKHRNLSSCLSVLREKERERDGEGGKSEEVAEGREKEEGRLKSREKGSVSMATTVPPTLFAHSLQRTLVVFV